MQERKILTVVGAQRSGTNLLQTIISARSQTEKSQFWKHALREEVAQELLDNVAVLLIAKHPVMWLQSCLVNRPEIFSRDRFLFLAGNSTEVGLANLYSAFYRGWLSHVEEGRGLFVRYEDLLSGDGTAPLIEGLAKYGWTFPNDTLTVKFAKVPNSLGFSDEDRDRYLRFKCTLDVEQATDFWAALDPQIAAKLGYRFEDIAFAKEVSIRSLAYRLSNQPGSLSAEELSKIKEAAPAQFQDDGTVLLPIARRIVRDGDYREALDWYFMTLRALEKEISQSQLRTHPANTIFFDVLDEIGALCATFKTVRLKQVEEECKTQRGQRELRPGQGKLLPFMDAAWSTSLSDLARRRGKLLEAIQHAREAVEIFPELKSSNYHLGILLAEAGQLAEAERELRLSIDDGSRDGSRHFALSDVLVRLGRLDEAIAEAQAATAGDRAEAWYFHHCGALLFRRDRCEEAAACFGQAVALEPNDRRHRFVLSDVLARLGRFEEALIEAEKATQGELTEAWYFHHYASLLARAERWTEAERSLRSAIDIDPRDYRHHFLLSDVLMRQDRIEAAAVEAEAAVQCQDAVPWCFHHLGALQMRLGRNLEAEANLRRAVEMEPANGRHRFLLSDILARLGRVDEALAEARQATQCADPTAWDFHHLGALLAQIGQAADAEAEAAFRRALAIEPENEHHRRALDDISQRQAKMPAVS